MTRNQIAALLGFGLVSIVPLPVLAQPTDATPITEEQRAEALRLLNTGHEMLQVPAQLDQACDTLTKSYSLHNRGDTLLNLAECHRRQGKTATAWREFDEAIRYAEAVEYSEAIAAASRLRDELAADLSKLLIEVPPESAEQASLLIILDGKRLPKEQWGQQLFVDPGLHVLTATADGHEKFEGSTEVKQQADRAIITVTLKKIPPAPPPKKPEAAPPPPAPKIEPGEVSTWSVIVGGAGLAMLGVATGFGVDTVNTKGELDDACGAERVCPPSFAFEDPRANELRSYGLFVGFGIAGISATTVGLVGLILGLQDSEVAGVAVAPWGSPDSAGLGFTADL